MAKPRERGEYYRKRANVYLQAGRSRSETHKLAMEDCREQFDVSDRTLRRDTKDYRKKRKAYPEKPVDDPVHDSDDEEEEQDEEPEPDPKPEQWVKDGDYHYDEEADLYLVYVNAANRMIEIEGDTARDMIRDYSNVITDDFTINAMSRKYSMPPSWFKELKRKLDWTKDHEPFTSEEIMQRDKNELTDDALQQRRNEVYKEIQQEKIKQDRKQAEKWRKIQQKQLDPLIDALEHVEPPKPSVSPDYSSTKQDKTCVIPLQDVHFGERGANSEFTLDRMEDRFRETTQKLLGRIKNVGEYDKLILGIMGDIFHVDTESETTTKGTHVDASASVRDIYVRGAQVITDFIETCRHIAPVEVACVDGNHDRVTSFTLMHHLEKIYKNTEGITFVDGDYDLKFTTFGRNLLAFSHGDRYRKSDKSEIFSREAAHLWDKPQNRYWLQGHEHGEEVQTDKSGVKRLRGMSMAPQSSFEKEKGYPHTPGMLSYVMDKKEGRIYTPSVNIREEEK